MFELQVLGFRAMVTCINKPTESAYVATARGSPRSPRSLQSLMEREYSIVLYIMAYPSIF